MNHYDSVNCRGVNKCDLIKTSGQVTFRRVSPWYPGHDGTHWDYHYILIHEEEDGDEGAGDEPEGEEEADQAAHDLPAPLLGHVALVLLP